MRRMTFKDVIVYLVMLWLVLATLSYMRANNIILGPRGQLHNIALTGFNTGMHSSVETVRGHWQAPGTIANYTINASDPRARRLNAYPFVLEDTHHPLTFTKSEALLTLANRRVFIVGDSLASEQYRMLRYMLTEKGISEFNITVKFIPLTVAVDGKLNHYSHVWDPAKEDPLSRKLKPEGSIAGDVIVISFGQWYTAWHFDSTPTFNGTLVWTLSLRTVHKALLLHAPAAQVLWTSINYHDGTNYSSLDYHLRNCTTEGDDVLAYASTARERLAHPQEGDYQVHYNRMTKAYFLKNIVSPGPWSFIDADAVTMFRLDGHKGMGFNDGRNTKADCLHHVEPGVMQ